MTQKWDGSIFQHFQRFFKFRITIIAASVAGLVVILISPLALQAIASVFNLNWVKLSNIGQAYGAISALIAGFALVGVAASVFLQARETRFNRRSDERVRHFELMRMAVEDPFYRQVFALPEMSEKEASLTGYINLLLYHWSIAWEFHDMPENNLRAILSDVLFSDAGRAYWSRFGEGWGRTASSKRQVEFVHIADLVYRESMASGVAAAQNASRIPWNRSLHPKATLSAFTAGIVFGALSSRIIRAKLRTR
jgi:hypothetical protein